MCRHGELSHNEGSGHRQAAVRRDQIRSDRITGKETLKNRQILQEYVFLTVLPIQLGLEITAVLQLFLSFLMTHPICGLSLSVPLSLDVGLTWITLSPSLIGLKTTQHQMTQTTEVREQPKTVDSSQPLYSLNLNSPRGWWGADSDLMS